MHRHHNYTRHTRLFLLFTLFGSLLALFVEVIAESQYLITRHIRPDTRDHSADLAFKKLELK